MNKITDRKQPSKLPKLIIRAQNSEEELEYLWYVLSKIPFYKENGYSYEIPKDKEFEEVARISPNFKSVDKQRLRKYFLENIYNAEFFNAGLRALENVRCDIESCMKRFVEFNHLWNFKLLPKYEITLTKYGPGGNYDVKTGKIVMMTRVDGTFKRPSPGHTPVHEMVHIGIEENIVQKYNLSHWEKESLVDLICFLSFKKELPNYHTQDRGDKRLIPYINEIALKNLPKAIEEYTTRLPR